MTPPPPEPGFLQLLEYLRSTRGFDFTGYKPSSLTSRIHKRMHMLGIEGFAEYQDHLEVHPEEFGELFNFMLINVTSFFRDPQIWRYVADQVVPAGIDLQVITRIDNAKPEQRYLGKEKQPPIPDNNVRQSPQQAAK